jgi:L-ascorbate metabolism protein UlaG (beta-lactamase superfamily)
MKGVFIAVLLGITASTSHTQRNTGKVTGGYRWVAGDAHRVFDNDIAAFVDDARERRRPDETGADSAIAGVRITFLANEGVMLTAGGEKVLIDALYTEYGDYAVPDRYTQSRLAVGKQPFDSVDVILVTHYHGDHFAPDPVATHLRANPAATLVTSQQVIDSLRSGTGLAGIIAARMLSRTTAGGLRARETINGVDVQVVGIPHVGRRHRHVEHLGFIIGIGGRRVLHVGDTEISARTFAPLRLDTARVDVALVPYWALLDDDSRNVIIRYIAPRHLVAIHVDAGADAGQRAARQIARVLPKAATFFRPLESRSW